MGSNKKYDNKAIITALRKACDPRVDLPSQVHFTMEGDNCNIYMPADQACGNLQNDPAAFEGWALALRTWLGCRVSMSWTLAKDVKDLHYQRFLYRAIRFDQAVGWFNVAFDCKNYLKDSLVLEPDGTPREAPGDFLVNVPGKRKKVEVDDVAMELSELTENELENHFFLRPQRLLDCIDWHADIMKQIPVGVFAEEVSRNSRVFPGAGGKVDLGAVDKSRGVALFELKKPGNRKVGSISELLFYAHVVRDIQKGTFGYEERKLGVNERLISGARSVTGFILADKLHPLLNNEALFETLNLAFLNRCEAFGFIKYGGMSNAIECERVFQGYGIALFSTCEKQDSIGTRIEHKKGVRMEKDNESSQDKDSRWAPFLEWLERIGKARENPKVIAFCIKSLRKGKPMPRSVAKRGLVIIGGAAVDYLLEVVTDGNLKARKAAAEALGKISDSRAIELLIDLLGDEHDSLVGESVKALANIGEPAVGQLIDALRSPRERIRIAAVDALAEMGRGDVHKAIEELALAMGDEDELVQEMARDALVSIGKQSVEVMIKITAGDNRIVRRGAEAVLIEIGATAGDEVIEMIIVTLKDSDRSESARLVLTNIGEPAVGLLVKNLNNDNLLIREETERIVVEIGEPAVLELVEATGDKGQEIAEAASRILKEIGRNAGYRAISSVVQCLGDKKRRDSAKQILVDIGEPAFPLLIEASINKDEKIQEAVEEIFVRIGSPAVDFLSGVLNDFEKGDPRASSARLLGRIGDKKAIPSLLEALADEDWGNVRRESAVALGEMKAKEVVKPLIGLLGDKDPTVRGAAARALGTIGDAEAVELLIGTLADEHPVVRQAASFALGEIGDSAAIEPLINKLHDEQEIVRKAAEEALVQIGLEAVDNLVFELASPNEEVRYRAVRALGSIKSDKAIQPLIDRIKDESERVRTAAIWALIKIGEPAVGPFFYAVLNDSEVRKALIDMIMNVLGEVGIEVAKAILQILLPKKWAEYLGKGLGKSAPKLQKAISMGIQQIDIKKFRDILRTLRKSQNSTGVKER